MAESYADDRLVQEGSLDPNAAFMQGRMKVAGDMAKLMALMPLTREPGVQGDPGADPRSHRVLGAY